MQKEYCKLGSEHDKEDLKQSNTGLSTYQGAANTRSPRNEENMCFWASKRAFASNCGSRERKRGKGAVAILLNLP